MLDRYLLYTLGILSDQSFQIQCGPVYPVDMSDIDGPTSGSEFIFPELNVEQSDVFQLPPIFSSSG